MNAESYRQFLKSTIPSARDASGGREILCRCFYCPDSRDPRHAHFYISIPSTPKEPSLYHCMKCHNSGIVTHRTLLEWGIYDDQIAIDLIKHNKNIDVQYRNRTHLTVPVINNKTTEDEFSEAKLKYFNTRLGLNYDYQKLRDMKIVLNLYDLLSQSPYKLTRHKNIADQLDRMFLGFLSLDNSHLNMRRLCDEGKVYRTIDKRYINYEVSHIDNASRFYTVPTGVDVNQTNRIKIHVAEGPFDIVSIYENLRHQEPGVYTSVGGSNYYGTVLYFLETFKLPYTEVHLYPDNDESGSLRKMQWIKQKLDPLFVPVYIHRNQMSGEKDFGVAPNRIIESVEQL